MSEQLYNYEVLAKVELLNEKIEKFEKSIAKSLDDLRQEINVLYLLNTKRDTIYSSKCKLEKDESGLYAPRFNSEYKVPEKDYVIQEKKSLEELDAEEVRQYLTKHYLVDCNLDESVSDADLCCYVDTPDKKVDWPKPDTFEQFKTF